MRSHETLFLMVTAALVMVWMVALAGPAFATIHEIARMECASENASAVVQEQNPPGLTGQSNGSSPNNATGTNIG